MEQDLPLHTGLEARIAAAVAPTLAHLGYSLVRVAVLGRNRPTVQIMVEYADGRPIGIGDCETITHVLGAVLDVEDPMPGAWTLEVSSAGIDRPLTRARDWNRFAGHRVRAELHAPVDGRRRFAGVALGATDIEARLRLDSGDEVAVPLDAIRRAQLVLTEDLIAAAAPPPPSQNLH